MKAIMVRQEERLRVSDIKRLEGCEDVSNLSELARRCGFDRLLKSLFFVESKVDRIKFRKEALVTAEQSQRIADYLCAKNGAEKAQLHQK